MIQVSFNARPEDGRDTGRARLNDMLPHFTHRFDVFAVFFVGRPMVFLAF
jgi:hypothetical protein